MLLVCKCKHPMCPNLSNEIRWRSLRTAVAPRTCCAFWATNVNLSKRFEATTSVRSRYIHEYTMGSPKWFSFDNGMHPFFARPWAST